MSRVLVVEDSPINMDMLEMALVSEGHDVLTAMDGATGLSTAYYELPDLVLMDMDLPILDGWSATRLLKSEQSTRHIPVIALTAHSTKAERERSLEAGCAAYVTKPVDLDYLKQKIAAVLGEAPPAPPVANSVTRSLWKAKRAGEGTGAVAEDQLWAERDALQAERDALRVERDALQDRIAEGEAERARLASEVASLGQKASAAAEDAPAAKPGRAEARARRTVLHARLDEATAAAAAARARSEALQSELDAAKARLEALEYLAGLPQETRQLQELVLKNTRQLYRTRSRLLALQSGVQAAVERSLAGGPDAEAGSELPDLEPLDEAVDDARRRERGALRQMPELLRRMSRLEALAGAARTDAESK